MIYDLIFSATGRSKRIRDAVGSEFGQERKLLDLSAADFSAGDITFTADDLCIFTTSVFEGRVPAPAAANMKKLSGNGAKILLVAVFGNRAVDDCLLEMRDIATGCGFVPVAAMEASVQHSIITNIRAERPDAEDIAQLKEFARKVKRTLEEKTDFPPLTLPGNAPYVEMGGIPFKPKANKKCIDCGLCAKKCPVGAIPTENPRVTDKNRCITCMRYVEICPEDARDFSPVLIKLAHMVMKSKFNGRKPNVLYLP